jgi:hypothetical protein
MLLKLSKKRPLLFKYCSMMVIQRGLSYAWKNGLQSCITLSVNLRPPLWLVFLAILLAALLLPLPLIVRHSAWCPYVDFLTMSVLYRAKVAHILSCLRMGLYACISLYLNGAVLRKDFLACVWAKFQSRKIECKKI